MDCTTTLEKPISSIRGNRRVIGVHRRFQSLFLAAATLLTLPALAEVTITDAWVRGTVAAQTATGAFMKIRSTEAAKIVGASSPAAKVVEVHEMSMKGGTMEMRPVTALPLPAGKVVELKSGGYHVMLMQLEKPLAAGDTVPIAFTVEGADGKRTTVEAKAKVRPLGARDEPAHKH